jgi:hypothetical protein
MEDLERYLKANPDASFELAWDEGTRAFRATIRLGWRTVSVSGSERESLAAKHLPGRPSGSRLAVWAVLQRAPLAPY